VLDVREYIDTAGRSPFTKWLRALNVQAGVLEYRVDFGPGYRIYFGRDGDRLVILLAGGMKKRQQEDIRQAKANWEDYRNRKIQERTRCH